jgi:hypothetical protein
MRDAEMSVVNNCGDQGDNDRDTESDDLKGQFSFSRTI